MEDVPARDRPGYIPPCNLRYVQRARVDVPQRTVNRCTQYIRYKQYVKWYEREATARGVRVIRDRTIPSEYCVVELSDEDGMEVWT
jgi:hypothetical protein